MSISADVTVHGFCQRSTMVWHERLCWKVLRLEPPTTPHPSTETSHGWQTPKQMPSFGIAVRWRGWCKLMHGASDRQRLPPRRHGELTFDAMTWWMGKLERAIVCGMDCGSRGASGG